jgi:RNA polymerase sigma factor (sigma-70 family)
MTTLNINANIDSSLDSKDSRLKPFLNNNDAPKLNDNGGIPSTLTFDFEDDVELAKSGNKDAFSRLVVKFSNTVSSIALAIVKDIDASHEVSQNAFIKAWQELGKLQNSRSFLPWLRQITRYTALSYLRSNKRKSDVEVTNDAIDYDFLLDSVCNAQDHSADSTIIKSQQNQLIKNLLSKLDAESHEVILLYYREEQNSQQVAELLDLTPANVRKKLERAKTKLKAQVLKNYGQIIYSSAPAGIAAIILSLISQTAPGVSATGLAFGLGSNASKITGASKSTSFLVAPFLKLFSFISFMGLGLVFALSANRYSMNKVLKNIDDKNTKSQLNKITRNTGWGMTAGIAIMTLGYVLTKGWVIPTLGYFVLCSSMFYSTKSVLAKTSDNVPKKSFQLGQKSIDLNCTYGYLGLSVGVLGGLAGLLFGLVESGRTLQLW